MPSSPSIFSKPGWLNCGNRLLWGRLRTSISSSTSASRSSLTNWGKSRLEWPTVKRGFAPLESGFEPELRTTKTPCDGLILPRLARSRRLTRPYGNPLEPAACATLAFEEAASQNETRRLQNGLVSPGRRFVGCGNPRNFRLLCPHVQPRGSARRAYQGLQNDCRRVSPEGCSSA